MGQLIEDALGATAGNRAVPDFEDLRVELKTVPIDTYGRPRESTYVTILPLKELHRTSFQTSSLAKKLACVLFVPVEADTNLPLSVRRVGSPMLWTPTSHQLHQLEQDWLLYQWRIQTSGIDAIRPQDGEYLQVRPKGADAQDKTTVRSSAERDDVVRTMRRGLYLRPRFIENLFSQYFHMPTKFT